MRSDFSMILSRLRKEKSISQRKAADDLEISQALLSHYEKGIREPGLKFVSKACDYYGVSADYLLGRTLVRDEDRGSPDQMKRFQNSMGVFSALSEIAFTIGGDEMLNDLLLCWGACAYKMFRFMEPDPLNHFFHIPEETFILTSELAQKTAEMRMVSRIRDLAGSGGEDLPGSLKEASPESYEALLKTISELDQYLMEFI